MRITQQQDMLITDLFDTITTHDCRTHEEISAASKMLTMDGVAQALAWIRDPAISAHYGWSVPHAPRGRPAATDQYRYFVVGLSGQVLNSDDIRMIRRGALSTVRQIVVETRNEAHALRLSSPMVGDKHYKKWSMDTAKILDGISTQAEMEVARLQTLLAVSTP